MGKNFDFQGVANTVAGNISNRENAAAVGQFINTALLTYQQHLERQKLDDMANGIMAKQDLDTAVANAPKAKAVQADDPDLQGTGDYNPDGGNVYTVGPAGPGDEAAHNDILGYGS